MCSQVTKKLMKPRQNRWIILIRLLVLPQEWWNIICCCVKMGSAIRIVAIQKNKIQTAIREVVNGRLQF